MRSKADRTQYLGERNKPGRCKLYNKQMESGLTSPLTRLEITVEGLAGPHQVAALWPTVYRMADVQGDAEIAALNDTDRFIFATLLDSPDRLNELGRRKRARFAGLLEKCRYRVEFDPQAYARVLADVQGAKLGRIRLAARQTSPRARRPDRPRKGARPLGVGPLTQQARTKCKGGPAQKE